MVTDASIVATIICALCDFQDNARESDYCDHFDAAPPMSRTEIDGFIADLESGRVTLTRTEGQ